MKEASSRAPGRVELLGNHTDYNQGITLAVAINYAVSVRGETRDDATIDLHSASFPDAVQASLGHLQHQSEEADWANYPLGVVDCLLKAGYPVKGFAAHYTSDLPSGAGLSSSAAIEVATASLLQKLYGLDLSPMDMAKICRRAENEFVGMQCGLLDQATSVFGAAGNAVYLDCRTEEVERVALPQSTALLVFASGVPHRLTGGEYNERRTQCFAAAAALGVPALRDVSTADVEAGRDRLDPTMYRRALHITGENERVARGVGLLRQGDGAGFGALMYQSHESSRQNFENSTPELDALVDIAREIPGVLGSRLTGGGFGGATISLIERAQATRIAAELDRLYTARTGNRGDALLCESADGAS